MEIVEILDEEYLLRRIPLNNPDYIKPDGSICSYAFKPPKKEIKEISVNIKRLTTYEDSVTNNLEFCLAQIKAIVFRENSLKCVHTPELSNYSHASVEGNFTNGVCKNLARNAAIIDSSQF